MTSKYISYNLPVLITKQNKRFVAYTPALDISTSGKSQKEAKKRFIELVNIFIEELITAGTVSDVLIELGWNRIQKKWTPPQVVSSQSIDLRVPALV